MPHKIKLAPEHYTGIRPRNRSDFASLAKACFYAAMAVGAVVALWVLQQHWQQVRELTWQSATGTIVDVQPDALTSYGSAYRPGPLYRIRVQVSFPFNGARQLRWITLRKSPETVAGIQLDAQRWRRASCVVRWNPNNSNQIDAEVS